MHKISKIIMSNVKAISQVKTNQKIKSHYDKMNYFCTQFTKLNKKKVYFLYIGRIKKKIYYTQLEDDFQFRRNTHGCIIKWT